MCWPKVFRHVIHDFESPFGVQVRIPAVHAHREHVGNLQVRLCAHRGKVKVPVRILDAQIIHQGRRKNRCQASHQRLIAEGIVLETGGEVEPIVQRREVGSPLVIKEVPCRKNFPLAEVVVDSEQHVVVVNRSGHLEIFGGQPKDVYFRIVDVGQVGQHSRVIKR